MQSLPSFDDLVESDEWYESGMAETMVGCARNLFDEWAAVGRLDRVQIGGRTLVSKTSINALVAQRALDGALLGQELAGQLLAVLHAYLENKIVVRSYEDALIFGGPLVCARRGRPSTARSLSLKHHTIAASTAAILRYGKEFATVDPAVFTTHGRFYDRLLGLPGVDKIHWVTPMDNPGDARRVSRWVRIDPTLHTVRLDRETAELVGEEYVEPVADVDEDA